MLNVSNSLFSKRNAYLNPNLWDVVALLIVLAVVIALAKAASQMSSPYQLGDVIPISLDPRYLPGYGVRTVLRMALAMLCSLAFTFIFGTWAAKSRRAEQIIIPMIDVLQSVPVLGFLSISVVFIALFPNSLIGVECVSVFVIFTAQAWNMALSFYQSLRTVPYDLKEAAHMFQLTPWQRFWKIEVPFAMPSLLWNTMLSMSAGWFFVVLSEAISVANQDINLPGIGSYVAVAIDKADMHAVLYAIIAMFVMILIYDQLLFRPLLVWAEKFRMEQTPDENCDESWFVNLLQRTRLLRKVADVYHILSEKFLNLPVFTGKNSRYIDANQMEAYWFRYLWNFGLVALITIALVLLARFVFNSITLQECVHVLLLGLITGVRVFSLIILCSLVWIPVGVWVGRHPSLTRIVQPLVQFFAAFPANLLFPVVVFVIVRYQLNVEIWVTPLMILGTQWYILFNVIAGASALPKDLYQATSNFGVRGWLWWKRLVLPGIFPHYITGAITAAGGAWNASIVAEVVSWGDTTLKATGIGAYITEYTLIGDFPRIALGISVMCLYVLFFNRVLWQPLYLMAEKRFGLE